MSEDLDSKTIHAIGIRDGYAEVLAESRDQGIKLKFLAEQYKQMTGDEHFSHKFHIS